MNHRVHLNETEGFLACECGLHIKVPFYNRLYQTLVFGEAHAEIINAEKVAA